VSPLHLGCLDVQAPKHQSNGVRPSMFPLQHRIKQVSYAKVENWNYEPFLPSSASCGRVYPHCSGALRACSIGLCSSARHGSKLIGHPAATELVPSIRRLNQPINLHLKVLLLGQIDPVDLAVLHLPLQHLHVKKNYIWMSKSKTNNYKAIVED
jgi:hypothetical protein